MEPEWDDDHDVNAEFEPPDDGLLLIEDGGSDGGNGGLMRRLRDLLGLGWRVGKKIAIAGAAITSAPIVLPPLAVLSTIGLAFVAPFGVLLAGYACMANVARFLVPGPKVGLVEGGREEREGLGEEWGRIDWGEAEKGEEMGGDGGDERYWLEDVTGEGEEEEEMGGDGGDERYWLEDVTGEGEEEEEEEEEEEKGPPFVEEAGEEENGAAAEVGGYPVVSIGVVEREGYPFVEDAGEEENGAAVEVGGYPVVSVGVMEREAVIEQPMHVEEGDEVDAPATVEGERIAAPEGEDEYGIVTTTTVEREVFVDNLEEERAEVLAGDGGAIGGEGVVPVLLTEETQLNPEFASVALEEQVADTVAVESMGAMETEDLLPVPGGGEGVVSVLLIEETQLSPEFASAAPEEQVAGTVAVESMGAIEPEDLKPIPGAAVREVEVVKPAENEGLYSEEKIWEQIDAMRTIVGYAVAQGPSFVEELKALYLFTGVEPPESFGLSSDLAE